MDELVVAAGAGPRRTGGRVWKGAPARALAREAVWGAGCAAAGVVFTLFLFALNRRAFFSDDTQAAFAPIYMAIGRSLAHGHWPALTLQMLNGGALAGEYQYALYNPFSLLACYFASLFKDQAVAEAVVVGMHYAVLGSGAFAFARASGANRPFAALAAVPFLTNNFIYYWLAESWITGLVSIAWLTWAMAFLMKAHENRWMWLGAALATALTVTSGCYHTVFILGIAIVVLAATRWRLEGARAAALPLVAAGLGVLLCLAAILPLRAMAQVAVRHGGLNNDGTLDMDLYGVLSPSNPFQLGHFDGFSGFTAIGAPIFFAGWYVVPLLPLIDWTKLRPAPANLIVLAALAIVFAVATQGPVQVLWVRYAIWYLAPLHLFLLAAFSVVATACGFARPTRTRLWAAVLIAYFGWLSSVQVMPEARYLAFAGALLICAFAAMGVLWSARSRHGYAWAGLAGTAILVVFTHTAIRTNSNQLDRHAPSAVTAISDLAAIPTTASVFLGDIDDTGDIGRAPEIEIAAMPLIHGASNPFGYSPFGHRAFSYRFWVQLWGTVVPGAEGNIFQPSGLGASTWADLLRIDQVVIPRVGDRPARVAAMAGPAWRVTAERPRTVTLARVAPAPRGPGSVAWTSPGLRLVAGGPASAEHETLAVTARGGHADRIVFDRVAWPGYRVTFAGRPLAIDPTATPLMTVALPDGAQTGALVVSYAPPYWRVGLASALAAVALLVAGLWLWPRWRARAA